jgi:hypothetical protein
VLQKGDAAFQQHTFFTDIATDSDFVGVIPRSIFFLFSKLPSGLQVFASFLQVYNERVFDLLSDEGKPLALHESK